MITHRILPTEEYGKLEGLPVGRFAELLRGSGCVIVVERDGEIVATQSIQAVVQAEGLWGREDVRKNAGVSRMLRRAVMRAIRERYGVDWFVTGADSDDMRRLLKKLHAESIGERFAVKVDKE